MKCLIVLSFEQTKIDYGINWLVFWSLWDKSCPWNRAAWKGKLLVINKPVTAVMPDRRGTLFVRRLQSSVHWVWHCKRPLWKSAVLANLATARIRSLDFCGTPTSTHWPVSCFPWFSQSVVQGLARQFWDRRVSSLCFHPLRPAFAVLRLLISSWCRCRNAVRPLCFWVAFLVTVNSVTRKGGINKCVLLAYTMDSHFFLQIPQGTEWKEVASILNIHEYKFISFSRLQLSYIAFPWLVFVVY